MNVPVWLWFATIAGILVLLAADLFIVDHNPHAIRVAEAARWVVFYVACAVLFGLGILVFFGGQYAGEFFAGYITEYSLSVDNLFVFVIIMTTFGVPAIYQHKVLLFGILAALVLRGLFIAAGAAVIEQFEWVFYLFGAFLLYTGWRLAFRRRERRGRGVPGERGAAAGPPVPAGDRRLPRRGGVHPDRRQAVRHADARRDAGDRDDGHPVRARLDPGDLRADQGAVPGLHRRTRSR